MYEDTTVGVVIPAYNEEGFVGDVIETVPEYVDRVYVIDDRSTDGTWAEIRAAADRVAAERVADGGVIDEMSPASTGEPPVATDETPTASTEPPAPIDEAPTASTEPPAETDEMATTADKPTEFSQRVVPIQHEENRGVGGAIKTGYQHARSDGIGVTAVLGGDGQMDPDELETVIKPVADGSADYVKGNRLLRAEDRVEMPTHRYVGNVLLSYITKIASGYWFIGDPQNGYTAISLAALKGADIDDMYEFYGYCNDLLVRLSATRFRVLDVPVAARYRDEESHIRYRTYIPRVSAMLLRTFLWRLFVCRSTRRESARTGLYVGGALMTVLSLVSSRRRIFGGGNKSTVRTVSTTVDHSNANGRTPSNAEHQTLTTEDARGEDVPNQGAPTEDDQSTRSGIGLFVMGVLTLAGGMLIDALNNRHLNGTHK